MGGVQVIFPDAVWSMLPLGKSPWSEQSFKPSLQIVLKEPGSTPKYSQVTKLAVLHYGISGVKYLSMLTSPLYLYSLKILQLAQGHRSVSIGDKLTSCKERDIICVYIVFWKQLYIDTGSALHLPQIANHLQVTHCVDFSADTSLQLSENSYLAYSISITLNSCEHLLKEISPKRCVRILRIKVCETSVWAKTEKQKFSVLLRVRHFPRKPDFCAHTNPWGSFE